MKILYWQWHSFMGQGVEHAFRQLELDYDTFFYQMTDWEQDDSFEEQLERRLQENEADVVFSINYNPLISKVCENYDRVYLAWIYDSPIHIRDISTMTNKCNRIFCFDRGQAREYQTQGVCAFYLPLAADVQTFGAIRVTETEQRSYHAEISMVGKLYQTPYQKYLSMLNPYLGGYLEGLVASQKMVYGGYLLHELLTDHMLEEVSQSVAKASTGQLTVERRELEFLLASEVTSRERYEALALLSNHFDVKLYSTEADERLSNVQHREYVDYYTQMPKVFKSTDINLNISLKTIQSGIPLRILDIMACGGFVLTNYQEELPEYFTLGEDIVTYGDMEEMFYQAKYYLQHEEERNKIAAKGLARVRESFTFEARVRTMLQSI